MLFEACIHYLLLSGMFTFFSYYPWPLCILAVLSATRANFLGYINKNTISHLIRWIWSVLERIDWFRGLCASFPPRSFQCIAILDANPNACVCELIYIHLKLNPSRGNRCIFVKQFAKVRHFFFLHWYILHAHRIHSDHFEQWTIRNLLAAFFRKWNALLLAN